MSGNVTRAAWKGNRLEPEQRDRLEVEARLRAADKADEMALATRSTRTLRLNQFPGSAPADPSA